MTKVTSPPKPIVRVRFIEPDAEDPKPMVWPIEYPYWVTGYNDFGAVLVAYARDLDTIRRLWPKAGNFDVEEVVGVEFSDRFPKPPWYSGPHRDIFVFGSNLAGRHGKGAAKDAYNQHGAKYGIGRGHVGQSYAIPTKGHNLKPLRLTDIERHVEDFVDFANSRPDLRFNVTRVGCGLAGYTDEEMAPLFKGMPSNVILPVEWQQVLSKRDG